MSKSTKTFAATDWKAVVKFLCNMHKSVGGATVALDCTNAALGDLALVNVTPGAKQLKVEGRELQGKDVRRWAWENRGHRAFKLKKAFLWSVYDEGERVSWVGWGVMVKPQIAERMGKVPVGG